MFETIREYAWEQLESHEETEMVRRYTQYFLALAEAAELELIGSQSEAWLARLETEQDNLRAALQWALECSEAEISPPAEWCIMGFLATTGILERGT